jgi:hypothetical protein
VAFSNKEIDGMAGGMGRTICGLDLALEFEQRLRLPVVGVTIGGSTSSEQNHGD